MKVTEHFSDDYALARRRFRQEVDRIGWDHESHPSGGLGPDGDELTIDVAISPATDTRKVLVVSSGMHGVEGCFGSAVQHASLRQWSADRQPGVRLLYLHALNPYGFARSRRFDQQNVDPNRNFLLAGEAYEGAPERYADLDRFLNPRRPPSRWEPFLPQALWALLRLGMPALQRAIATGQYEYPQGLFFGGSRRSELYDVLQQHLPRWLQGAEQVLHLDFHTGLGRWGTGKLLFDTPLPEQQKRRLVEWFGAEVIDMTDWKETGYAPRGSFYRWMVESKFTANCVSACAEFGTYGPVRIVAGLRAENQAHHWGTPESPATRRARERLRELFCPQSEQWRGQVLHTGVKWINTAIDGLSSSA